jgi:hypothetical protein
MRTSTQGRAHTFHSVIYEEEKTMKHIYRLAQQIVDAAERYEQFYEVELSIMVRKEGGQKSDFIRLQSEKSAPADAKVKADESVNHIEF